MTSLAISARPAIDLAEFIRPFDLPSTRNLMPILGVVYAIALPVILAIAT